MLSPIDGPSAEGPRPGAIAALALAAAVLVLGPAPAANAQVPNARTGEVVPRDVREMYDRGLQYLASTQGEDGEWPNAGVERGPGGIGVCLMAFLASGE